MKPRAASDMLPAGMVKDGNAAGTVADAKAAAEAEAEAEADEEEEDEKGPGPDEGPVGIAIGGL